MARGGLYKSDVQKARQSLLAQGKRPSVDAVRIALGNTGSKTTIHRYLKELEAEEGQGVGATVAVSDALQDLVGRLAARLHEEADARIADAKAAQEAVLKARDDALVQVRQEAATLSTQLQRTETALQTESQARIQVEQALQAGTVRAGQLEERIAGLTAQLAEREQHTASLEEKHAQGREALEHFRTSAKEQRDQELRRHEHQVQGLQVELRQVQETLTAKNLELMQLNRDNARLTEQIGQQGKEIRQATQDQRTLTEQIGELKQKANDYKALEALREQELQAANTVRMELEIAQRELHTEREVRRGAEITITGLKARLQTIEEVLTKLQLASDPPPSKSS